MSSGERGIDNRIPPFYERGVGGISTVAGMPPLLKSPPAPLLQRGEQTANFSEITFPVLVCID